MSFESLIVHFPVTASEHNAYEWPRMVMKRSVVVAALHVVQVNPECGDAENDVPDQEGIMRWAYDGFPKERHAPTTDLSF